MTTLDVFIIVLSMAIGTWFIINDPVKLLRNEKEYRKRLDRAQRELVSLRSRNKMLEEQVKKMKPAFDKQKPKNKTQRKKQKGFRIFNYFINIQKREHEKSSNFQNRTGKRGN